MVDMKCCTAMIAFDSDIFHVLLFLCGIRPLSLKTLRLAGIMSVSSPFPISSLEITLRLSERTSGSV